MRSPVTVFIFNRPDLAEGLMARLRAGRPEHLLIVSDGARNEEEAEKVRRCRDILEAVDWPCQVDREYATENLGCRLRLQSGLDVAFSLFDRTIVLEDDVYPDPTFFPFCDEMLEKYQHDTRIMTITAGHFMRSRLRMTDSYYFSTFPSVWGWASWRRTWALYDRDMALWPRLKHARWLLHHLKDPEAAAHYTRAFDEVSSGRVDTWDYQLTYSIWLQHGLNIVPPWPLCENRGFRSDATHTRSPSPFSELKAEPMTFPLTHPAHMIPSPAGEELYKREHLRLFPAHI
jgi:hypothetical protein